MIAAIVALNSLIALVGFYLAWRLWRLRVSLLGVADDLAIWEQQLQAALQPQGSSPPLQQARQGTAQLRSQYQLIRQQLRLLRGLWRMLGLVLGLSRWLLPGLGRQLRPFPSAIPGARGRRNRLPR